MSKPSKCIILNGCKNEQICQIELAGKYHEQHRYDHFGECVNSLSIKGFRGLRCDIEFRYPVTAITGKNGIGKTTVGQLLLCAYKASPNSNSSRNYIYKFFPKSNIDSNPFEDDAEVEYVYQADGKKQKENPVTVSRDHNRWRGYGKQPKKATTLVGPSTFLPKHERADLTIYHANDLEIHRRVEIENGLMWINRILGNNYKDVFSQEVTAGIRAAGRTRGILVNMAKRNNATYSENNMGLGEARVIRMIQILERCDEKSLIVLDEPDIGLHVSAQREFLKYLICLSYRRGHQIVFSTHSSEMTDGLPPAGRVILERHGDLTIAVNSVSSISVQNALSDGKDGFIIVAVEDEFSKKFLNEIIIKCKKELRNKITIQPIGDTNDVRNFVTTLKRTNIKVTGFLDADQKDNEKRIMEENRQKENKDKLLVLPIFPGQPIPPEEAVFKNKSVKNMVQKEYSFDLDHYFVSHPNSDHHEYSYRIHQKSKRDIAEIERDCIIQFLKSKSPKWGQRIIEHLEKVMIS